MGGKQYFEDSSYKWEYGIPKASNVKKYNINSNNDLAVSAKNVNSQTGFNFRTAESFLNNLEKKKNNLVDLSAYKPGSKVFHRKFGEGVINIVEQEGEDLKLDINFDKFGHKRLMARFANLEII